MNLTARGRNIPSARQFAARYETAVQLRADDKQKAISVALTYREWVSRREVSVVHKTGTRRGFATSTIGRSVCPLIGWCSAWSHLPAAAAAPHQRVRATQETHFAPALVAVNG